MKIHGGVVKRTVVGRLMNEQTLINVKGNVPKLELWQMLPFEERRRCALWSIVMIKSTHDEKDSNAGTFLRA